MSRLLPTSLANALLAAVSSAALLAACGSDSSTSSIGQTGSADGSVGASTSGGGNAGAGATNGGGGFSGQTLMGVDANAPGLGTTQCSDGKDNDGDGLIDGFDPECTGPFDNDESSFATGIPGDNRDPKWQDCFFDGNSGGGDDGCRYSTDCLTGAIPETSKDCQLTQQCLNNCMWRVPNGCDCFGCCSVYTSNGQHVDIEIGASCTLDNVNDTTACPRCTKSTQCNNTCDTCELCIGKTVADLPASCAPADAGTPGPDAAPPPPAYTCTTPGQTTCASSADCPNGGYCAQGCCQLAPH